VQTFVCMNMSVCIGSGCDYVMYLYTKKKLIFGNMWISWRNI
jgi:hypothetical protein